jgi:exodeoxyribonuclease VII large subunit
VRAALEARRSSFARTGAKLESLSPLAVLGRGYALVWSEGGRRLVRRPDEVAQGDALRIRVAGGEIGATVTAPAPTPSSEETA